MSWPSGGTCTSPRGQGPPVLVTELGQQPLPCLAAQVPAGQRISRTAQRAQLQRHPERNPQPAGHLDRPGAGGAGGRNSVPRSPAWPLALASQGNISRLTSGRTNQTPEVADERHTQETGVYVREPAGKSLGSRSWRAAAGRSRTGVAPCNSSQSTGKVSSWPCGASGTSRSPITAARLRHLHHCPPAVVCNVSGLEAMESRLRRQLGQPRPASGQQLLRSTLPPRLRPARVAAVLGLSSPSP
jgi:hypothetical protein